MSDLAGTLFLAVIGVIVLLFVLGMAFGGFLKHTPIREAISECEQNLPRSQKCYAVIVAEPEGEE